MITKIIPEEKIIQAHKAIDRAERIVIISLIGPDGDALEVLWVCIIFVFGQRNQDYHAKCISVF